MPGRRYNQRSDSVPCDVCGAPTEKEITVAEVCTGCGTYVEDCSCPIVRREEPPATRPG